MLYMKTLNRVSRKQAFIPRITKGDRQPSGKRLKVSWSKLTTPICGYVKDVLTRFKMDLSVCLFLAIFVRLKKIKRENICQPQFNIHQRPINLH